MDHMMLNTDPPGLAATNDPRPVAPTHIHQERLKQSLETVLRLWEQSDFERELEEAMIALGLYEDWFVEPLNRHEVHVLATSLYSERSGGGAEISYSTVLQVTEQFNGRPMNLAMVYKTIERLMSKGLLDEIINSAEGKAGRSRLYKINNFGRDAFKMAILNAETLKAAEGQAVA
ncbi:hypothetical protein ACFOEZ_03825 [Tianweitania populi]|uniref:Uncharacterized protein n=1 Tax=Tianweitania populi TaxID=1607949 RepID=A0A8J3GIF8_9HYPH|nr:hypothetical protein [Tianweitania populi]GHD07435.1 hypothetical protein GCM10016234_05840 [Tianweitania populi]